MKAMRRNGRCVTPVLMVVALAVLAAPARADDAVDARQLVEKAKLTFESVIVAPEMDALRDLLKGAKGVFVAPQVLRGAFIFGVSGGSGIFFARGERPEQWSGPAFYTIGEVSFGLQAGAEAPAVDDRVVEPHQPAPGIRLAGGDAAEQAAGNRVAASARPKTVPPAKALLLKPSRFRFWRDVRSLGSAMGLAERVTARDEGHGFFVVHRHPAERFPDIVRCP